MCCVDIYISCKNIKKMIIKDIKQFWDIVFSERGEKWVKNVENGFFIVFVFFYKKRFVERMVYVNIC